MCALEGRDASTQPWQTQEVWNLLYTLPRPRIAKYFYQWLKSAFMGCDDLAKITHIPAYARNDVIFDTKRNTMICTSSSCVLDPSTAFVEMSHMCMMVPLTPSFIKPVMWMHSFRNEGDKHCVTLWKNQYWMVLFSPVQNPIGKVITEKRYPHFMGKQICPGAPAGFNIDHCVHWSHEEKKMESCRFGGVIYTYNPASMKTAQMMSNQLLNFRPMLESLTFQPL